MAGKKPTTITLMMPGLFPFSSDQWQALNQHLPALPALTDLLNQSRRTSPVHSDFETILGEKFGLTAGQRIPVAALTYWYDKGRPPARHVLRADPVFLKVDRDCLYVLGRHSLQVSLHEANRLAALINDLYVDLPWSLEVGNAERWYICADDDFNIETRCITEVFGKNIETYLPEGQAKTTWRSVINEMQMLLHTSDVNQHREAKRQLPINSLWLWGEGELPSRPPQGSETVGHVYSNDALCRGLAHWARCAGDALPEKANEWIGQEKADRCLLVFDDLRILAREDFQAWEQKLLEVDNNWLAPLRDAVNKQQLLLNIEIDNGMKFTCAKTVWNTIWHKKRRWYEWFQ